MVRLTRRGFITAILAAPLAAVGSFAGNHSGSWVEMIASDCHIGKPSTFKGVTGMWTNLYKDEDPLKPWVYLEFADGRIIRHEKFTKLPFYPMGDFAGVES